MSLHSILFKYIRQTVNTINCAVGDDGDEERRMEGGREHSEQGKEKEYKIFIPKF